MTSDSTAPTSADPIDAPDAPDADAVGPVERIRRAYGTLTAAEQEAAQFILGHLTETLVSTSAELAVLCGVSQPTLSRLYRKLGYANASAFRHDVRRTHQPGAPETDGAMRPDDDLAGVRLRADIDSLRRTFARLDTADVERAAALLVDARRVVVAGWRNGYPVALHLREQLVQLRPDVSAAPQPGQSVAEEIADLGPRDAAVLVGVRRRPEGFGRLVRALAEAGVPTVIIGDATVRAVSGDAPVLEADLNTQMLSSYTAAFSLAALLVDAVAARLTAVDPTRAGERIGRINGRFARLRELEGHPCPSPRAAARPVSASGTMTGTPRDA